MNHKLFLSRRNIFTLLSKLDRVKKGEISACTLVKFDTANKNFPQTMESCAVTAVENLDDSCISTPDHIFLSRSDLITLSTCLLTLKYSRDNNILEIKGVKDDNYYTDRLPGGVFAADDPDNKMGK